MTILLTPSNPVCKGCAEAYGLTPRGPYGDKSGTPVSPIWLVDDCAICGAHDLTLVRLDYNPPLDVADGKESRDA